jgi:hypothetical protein
MFDARKINESVDVIQTVGGASLYTGTGRTTAIGGAARYTGAAATDGDDYVDLRGGADQYYQEQLKADDKDVMLSATKDEDQDFEGLANKPNPDVINPIGESRNSANRILLNVRAISEGFIPSDPTGWAEGGLAAQVLASQGDELDTNHQATLAKALDPCAKAVGGVLDMASMTITVPTDEAIYKLLYACNSKRGFMAGFSKGTSGVSVNVVSPSERKIFTFNNDSTVQISG